MPSIASHTPQPIHLPLLLLPAVDLSSGLMTHTRSWLTAWPVSARWALLRVGRHWTATISHVGGQTQQCTIGFCLLSHLCRLQNLMKKWDSGQLSLAAPTAAAPQPAFGGFAATPWPASGGSAAAPQPASGSSAPQPAAAPASSKQARGGSGGVFMFWKRENWDTVKAKAAADAAGQQKKPSASDFNKVAGELWQALSVEEKEAVTARWRGEG